MPLVDRMTVQNSWDSLRRKLEDLPLQLEKFEKMNLNILPPQAVDNPIVIPDHLSQINKEDVVKVWKGILFRRILMMLILMKISEKDWMF